MANNNDLSVSEVHIEIREKRKYTSIARILKYRIKYNILETRTLNKNSEHCVVRSIREDTDVILYLKYKGEEEGEEKTN